MATLQITKNKTTGKVQGWLIGEGGALTSPDCTTLIKEISNEDVPKILSHEYEPQLDADGNVALIKRQWAIDRDLKKTARETLKSRFDAGTQIATDVIEAIKQLL